MNIKKGKQKGSSLVLVLMTFSVLTILGLAILSLTLSSFKSRIVESSERRNQYFAESGIDLAYGEIGKVVDKGINDGNQAVQVFMNGLNDILDRERENVKNGAISNYINTDGTVNEAYIKQMQNQTFQTSYKASVISSVNNWYDTNQNKFSIPVNSSSYNSTDSFKVPEVTINAKQDDLEFKNITYKNITQSALTLNLSSDFQENSMKKIISVNYNILLPNYKDTYYIETNEFKLPINPVWNKAFCIDGNLNINGDFEVKSGDVYVKGKDGDDSGINVIASSGSNVTFNGNVSSFGGVQISGNNNTITFKNNLYSGNVLIKDEGNNTNFTVNGAVYTNNDLAVNGKASTVRIEQGFYGINDVTKAEGIADNQKPKVSSCLRVNSDDIGTGTSINIGKEAIIMGTAYIKTLDNTTPFYQTGESVAIKGNYRAYTNPLASTSEGDTEVEKLAREKLKEANVIFEYINPLQLVTKFKNEDLLSWQDKSDYFHLYAKDHKDDKELNLGTGITLPATMTHIGAIVANNDTSSGNFINDNDGNVKDKQDSYSLKVYAMDDAGKDDVNSTSIDLGDAFAKNELKRTIFSLDSNGQVNKSMSQVDFTKLGINQLSTISSGYGSSIDTIYLNSDDKQDCILVGKNAVIDEEKYKNAKKITLLNGSGRGIILTRGNVYLAGEVDFTGTIISTGDMTTLDNSKKTLSYDANYVERLIAYNYNQYFKDVFIRNSVSNSQNIEVDSTVNKDNNVGTDTLRDKLIIMENWKIIK